eukprot:8592583-Ditylum_brightwellii.AAC.1
MMYISWLKSQIKTEKEGVKHNCHRNVQRRNKLSGLCKHYYVAGRKDRLAKIITKQGKLKVKPTFYAFSSTIQDNLPTLVRFDSDSFLISVDNQASYCMTNQ